MKKLTNLLIAAALTAGFSGILNAGNFESDLQYGLKNRAAVTLPEPVQPRASLKAGSMSDLALKMVSFKEKMARVELELWNITRIIENKEGGSLDNSLRELTGSLKKCTAAAKELNVLAGEAVKTPKTPESMAMAKLVLSNIAEYVDNDETIATIRFESIMKESEYKDMIQPQIAEYTKTMEALANAGEKVMAYSGPIQSE